MIEINNSRIEVLEIEKMLIEKKLDGENKIQSVYENDLDLNLDSQIDSEGDDISEI